MIQRSPHYLALRSLSGDFINGFRQHVTTGSSIVSYPGPINLPVFLGRSLGARQQLKESRKNWPLEPITQAMILRYWGLHTGSWLQRSDKPSWLPAPKDHPEYHRLNSQFNGLNMNSLGKGTFCWDWRLYFDYMFIASKGESCQVFSL